MAYNSDLYHWIKRKREWSAVSVKAEEGDETAEAFNQEDEVTPVTADLSASAAEQTLAPIEANKPGRKALPSELPRVKRR